jgi:hypothetical protein
VRGEPDGSLKTHRSHAHLTVKPKGRGGEAPLSLHSLQFGLKMSQQNTIKRSLR